MEKIREQVEEIRRLEGVKPGDPMLGNPDQGHCGQTVDNLTHSSEEADSYGAWKEVRENATFRAQMVETMTGYINWLRKQQEEQKK